MGIVARLARRTAARFIPGMSATIRCSACQREKDSSIQMIAGPRVYLCSDCFRRAARQLTPRRPTSDAIRCRFCGSLRVPLDITHVESVAVCSDCLGLMDQMLEAVANSPREAR